MTLKSELKPLLNSRRESYGGVIITSVGKEMLKNPSHGGVTITCASPLLMRNEWVMADMRTC